MDASLVRRLADLNISVEMQVEALMCVRLKHGEKVEKVDPHKRTSYIVATISRMQASANESRAARERADHALRVVPSGQEATNTAPNAEDGHHRDIAPNERHERAGNSQPLDRDGDQWPDLIPLIRTPAPLPVDALGPTLGPFVAALAESLQIPTDLAANLGLPVITTAAAGEWFVRVTEDWQEPLILATVSAAESGERKSAMIKAVTAPLEEFEAEARREMTPEIATARARAELLSARLREAQKKAVKDPNNDAAEAAYFEAAAELRDVYVPPEPRWLADDTTPERLVSLLDEQGGALGVFSAEGGFFASLGRYTDSPQLDGVLKATAGDSIRVDRQGRQPVDISDPALSVGLCTQPGRLAELGRDDQFRASGLLARFAYVLPEPRVGYREIDTASVPPEVRQRWHDAITRLADVGFRLRQDRQEAKQNRQPEPPRREITLDTEAAQVLRNFRIEGERELRVTGSLATARDWGSKSFGLAARIAAALTLLEDPKAEVIGGPTMADAVRLVKAYAAHVLAAFGEIAGRDDELVQAQEVVRWLKDNGQPVVKLGELRERMKNRSWTKGRAKQAIEAALAVLAEHGHVRLEKVKTGGQGRPSEVVRVNPALLA